MDEVRAHPTPRFTVRGFAPFGGAAALAWITVPIATSIEWAQYAAATGVLAGGSRREAAGRTKAGE